MTNSGFVSNGKMEIAIKLKLSITIELKGENNNGKTS